MYGDYMDFIDFMWAKFWILVVLAFLYGFFKAFLK